eukprot:s7866_g5.t1
MSTPDVPEPLISSPEVKKLPCASGQFFGRPNWGRIFKQNREKHQGEHIGVFLCGSPIIGEELGRQSVKNSDVIGTPGRMLPSRLDPCNMENET